jgi:hypothetical protein
MVPSELFSIVAVFTDLLLWFPEDNAPTAGDGLSVVIDARNLRIMHVSMLPPLGFASPFEMGFSVQPPVWQ